MDSYFKKLVEAFVKDEYKIEQVDLEIKIKNAIGDIENLERLMHEETHENSHEENDTT
jgi:hypothetical protein